MKTRKEYFDAHNEIIERAETLGDEIADLINVTTNFYYYMRLKMKNWLVGDDYDRLYKLIRAIEDGNILEYLDSFLFALEEFSDNVQQLDMEEESKL